MTSSANAEPKGSEPSSTEHKHCITHPYGWPHTDGKCCGCGVTREELEPKKPELRPRCTCGHFRTNHNGGKAACIILGCECEGYVCDHSGCGRKPREECQHPDKYNYGFASGPPAIRYLYCPGCKAKWEETQEPEEPPMTPEEEEQAPEDECPECGDTGACNGGPCPPASPPQPEQRPPYAVAYSVQGHLYEVALSGDASVRAVDGALVIQHTLGPIAGIVQTRPVINERSADGAQADH
jgi:hypothetical protein